MTQAKRRGRPTKAPRGNQRVALGLRVTADIKRKLDKAAAISGRSQSQEAEFRLEMSFSKQDLLSQLFTLAYGPEVGRMFAKLHESGVKPTDDAVEQVGELVKEYLRGRAT